MGSLVRHVALGGIFCMVFLGFGLIAYIIDQAQDQESVLVAQLLDKDQKITKAFFSPDDTIKNILVQLIESEKKKIITAIYTFTENDIAHALIEAQDRGVQIEVITDRSYGADRYSKIPLLANNRVPIWIYQTDPDERKASLMHNKFCVFIDNIKHKSILWTGSYNFTQRATVRNQENIVILDNPELIQRFNAQFELLKTRSLLISGKPCVDYTSSVKTDQQSSVLYKLKRWLRKIQIPI